MSNGSEKAESSFEKLLIDDTSNFQFHAAYLAYSEAFDKIDTPEIKKQLNEGIQALQKGEINYSAFYSSINKYREENRTKGHRRAQIRTQRKRDWRKNTQKRERNKRYRR